MTWDELRAKLQVRGVSISEDQLKIDVRTLNERWEQNNAGKEIVINEGRGRGKKTTIYLRRDVQVNGVRR